MDFLDQVRKTIGTPNSHLEIARLIERENTLTYIQLRKEQEAKDSLRLSEVKEFVKKSCPRCNKRMRVRFEKLPLFAVHIEVYCEECQYTEVF